MNDSEHPDSAPQTKSWKAIQAQVQSLAIKSAEAAIEWLRSTSGTFKGQTTEDFIEEMKDAWVPDEG